MSKTFKAKYAIISKTGEISLFEKTISYYQWSQVERILKDVELELWDDHIIYIKGIPAKGYYTDEPIYVDEMTEEFKEKLLPVSTKKTLFAKREYIIGCYRLWKDYTIEMYLKLNPYRITVEP